MLTDTDKDAIIERIRQGLPLPERWRSLLIARPERLELTWPGKGASSSLEPRLFSLREIHHPQGKPSEIPPAALAAGWTNLLAQADNREFLAALKNGPLRERIARCGGIQLIYADPPFAVGMDFQLEMPVGEKGRGLERPAYRDTWQEGGRCPADFVRMLHERLLLMHEVLSDTGSLFLHCDWRTSAVARLLLDEVFGPEMFCNEIIWHYTGGGRAASHFSRKHDTLFWYSKTKNKIFNPDAVRVPYKKNSGYAKSGIVSAKGKRYLPHPLGTPVDDTWDIPIINPLAAERSGYPTPKPEALLRRILAACSREGDLVADFFCGSGTTLAVAEEMDRRWLGSDQSPAAVHTARKRLLEAQGRRCGQGKEARPFAVLEAESLIQSQEAPFTARVCRGAAGVWVELTGFYPDARPAKGLESGRLEIRNGRLAGVRRVDGEERWENLTQRWDDWVDFWSVDFTRRDPARPEEGPFNGHWRVFRTRRRRTLALRSPEHPWPEGPGSLAVLVVDILGNIHQRIIPAPEDAAQHRPRG